MKRSHVEPELITIASMNFSPIHGDAKAAVEKMSANIVEAAEQGADLVLFPELALLGRELFGVCGSRRALRDPFAFGGDRARPLQRCNRRVGTGARPLCHLRVAATGAFVPLPSRSSIQRRNWRRISIQKRWTPSSSSFSNREAPGALKSYCSETTGRTASFLYLMD